MPSQENGLKQTLLLITGTTQYTEVFNYQFISECTNCQEDFSKQHQQKVKRSYHFIVSQRTSMSTIVAIYRIAVLFRKPGLQAFTSAVSDESMQFIPQHDNTQLPINPIDNPIISIINQTPSNSLLNQGENEEVKQQAFLLPLWYRVGFGMIPIKFDWLEHVAMRTMWSYHTMSVQCPTQDATIGFEHLGYFKT